MQNMRNARLKEKKSTLKFFFETTTSKLRFINLTAVRALLSISHVTTKSNLGVFGENFPSETLSLNLAGNEAIFSYFCPFCLFAVLSCY